MAITTFTDDMDIIAALDDEPNDVGGLTAAQLKAKFDEAGNTIQTYINDSLIPELDAVNLPYQYGSPTTMKEQIDNIVLGQVPDASITTAKLADDAVTSAKIADGVVWSKDETATSSTLSLFDATTPDDIFVNLAGLQLIQSYTTAGSYSWTVPTGVTNVTVALIGGGGSGAARSTVSSSTTNHYCTGGGSGEALLLEDYTVTPGNNISIVIGAGGTSVSKTSSSGGQSGDGVSGGSTSFNGNTVSGGDGGYQSATTAVHGGQTAPQWYLVTKYTASGDHISKLLVFGGIIIPYPDSSTYGYAGISKSQNVFDRLVNLGIIPFTLCAGNPAYCGDSTTYYYGPSSTNAILPNGNNGSKSAALSGTSSVTATATQGTDPGCGGGAAAAFTTSGTAISTSAAGADGGVFIYVKG